MGAATARLSSGVTGCQTEEEAKVWLDRFLTTPPPKRRRIVVTGRPIALQGRTAAEFRAAERLRDCLTEAILGIKEIDPDLARRGVALDLPQVATQLANLQAYITRLRSALEIDP
jgi:hypothetical protein